MHILFVHPNFPAQFGHIAHYLVQKHSFECTFATARPGENVGGIRRVQFHRESGATAATHFFSRTFENQIWNSDALYKALAAKPEIRPDLIVAHTGFLTTIYLRELYDCPIINYFEFFYKTKDSDVDFRKDLPLPNQRAMLRTRTRNAGLLLDLDNCDAGYSPTEFQKSQLPAVYQPKVHTIFDGIDTETWYPREVAERRVGDFKIPESTKIVTYVSRGLESMRGFDVFMRMAKRVCDQRDDVVFLVVGEDRDAYSGDARVSGEQSFKQWVLSQDNYDLERIRFLGTVRPLALAELLSLTDLHVYWTAPFVLSWSLMNALSCGALVAASDTAPVREMIDNEQNGLLFDFFDTDQQVACVNRVLDDPRQFAPLTQTGLQMVRDKYSLEVCLPKMLRLYELVTR